MQLEIKAALQIQRPVEEVYEAIVDPEKMKHYFISFGSGRLEEGATITWKFPEFDMEVPVKVGKVEENQYISFNWGSEEEPMLVTISLQPQEDGSTVVTVTEKGKENNAEGIEWLKGNTEGWANFLACMKAYLEYGINLRRGAFDFRSDKG
jgi:uncharacterized protein YndB with AHSA1/START domain